MRSVRRSVGLVGLAVAVVLACGSPAVAAGSSGPARPAAGSAAAGSRPLGRLTALSWRVDTPVGARLVVRPHLSFRVQRRALQVLDGRKPRLSGSFTARIVTRPVQGGGRTLAVLSRQVRDLAVRPSAARSLLGRRLRLKTWVLSRRQTAIIKRAAKQSRLAITVETRYRASYTDTRGRTVTTPTRSHSATLPIGLRRERARGGDLRELAVTFRQLLGRVGQLKTACVTRTTISEQLRNAYSAMVSGDRSGAAALLAIGLADAEAMGTSGLLSREQSATLRSELGSVLQRVGSGRSARVERPGRWSSLPTCGLGRARSTRAVAHSAQLVAIVAKRRVKKRVRRTIRRAAERKALPCTTVFECASNAKVSPPGLGLRGLLESEWPADASQPTVAVFLPPGDSSAEVALEDLKAGINSFLKWEDCCLATNPVQVGDAWNSVRNRFVENKWRFQPSSVYYSVSDQVELLPLFTEFENMYLTLLREGVENGPKWGLLVDTTLSIEDEIRAELNPSNPASAMSYTKNVYDAGLTLEGSSTDPETNFAKNNDYKREMQIAVLDLRDMWYLQDPMARPFGDPAFKQDRIIYSDAVGETGHDFSPPANPSSPLSALTVWTKRVSYSYHYDQNWLAAVQADNRPQVGSPTGATGGTATTYDDVAPGAARGPVVQVDASRDQKNAITDKQWLIGTARFWFSNGTSAAPGGAFYTAPSYPNYSSDCCWTSFAYDDEVLAGAKIMGGYTWSDGNPVGDSMVFGFRQADSFATSWHGSLPGTVRAPDTQSCLAVQGVTITSGSHIGTTTGSRANGAPLETHDCNGGWEQTWLYIDYNDPDSAADDASQHALAVYAGTMCAAPKDGGTTAGTLVQAYDCDGTSPQKWTRNADASITSDQSGLCLERAGGAISNGTAIRLGTCNGGAAQKWTSPV